MKPFFLRIMAQYRLICLCLCCFFAVGEALDKKVCLNMIVKNEKAVIERCLASTLPFIDTWVIVDTGSTDGTQEIIQTFFAKRHISGKLYERPWVNFEHNRNEALDLAQSEADYILLMDADDLLAASPSFSLEELSADCYRVLVRGPTWTCMAPRFVKARSGWRWYGVIHEQILAPGEPTFVDLQGIEYVYNHDGARGKDEKTLERDLSILKAALEKEPNHPRYMYFLASTYMCLGQYEQALEICKKRVQMKGCEEEKFVMKLSMGQIQNNLGYDSLTVKKSLIEAYLDRPGRLESLYYLGLRLWNEQDYQKGYEILRLAMLLPSKTSDTLFVEQWIYEFGLSALYTRFLAALGLYEEGLRRCQEVLDVLYFLPSSSPSSQETKAELIELKDHMEKSLKQKAQEKLLQWIEGWKINEIS